MVFLFGYEVPIVEILVVVSVLALLIFIVLLYALRNVNIINKKLDMELKEEKMLQKEFAGLKKEEHMQLEVIRQIAREMSILNTISKEEHESMLDLKELLSEVEHLEGLEKGSKKYRGYMRKMNVHLTRLDRISSKENKQLEFIQKILKDAKGR